MTEKKTTAPGEEGKAEDRRSWSVRVLRSIEQFEKLIESGESAGWIDDARASLAGALADELGETLVGQGPSGAAVHAMGSKRHWVEECRRLRLTQRLLAAPVEPYFCEWARGRLSRIDSRASALTDDQIVAAFRQRKIRSFAGLAARLAAYCTAFGYSDFKTAKEAFANALKESP